MPRIYTGVGDSGTTRLFDGSDVPKTHPLLEACGTLDELNSQIGVVRSASTDPEIDRLLERVQSVLFELGAELVKPEAAEGRMTDEDVRWVEGEIDRAMGQCPPLRSFLLPGGTPAASHLHVARTVCRRAERRIVALGEGTPVSPVVLRFLNRLSDLFFALARLTNVRAGVPDAVWKPRSG